MSNNLNFNPGNYHYIFTQRKKIQKLKIYKKNFSFYQLEQYIINPDFVLHGSGSEGALDEFHITSLKNNKYLEYLKSTAGIIKTPFTNSAMASINIEDLNLSQDILNANSFVDQNAITEFIYNHSSSFSRNS